tara:strand:- start:255 stop:641 length:387 start_codon:yes stop_codon:yes gene_type:complete
MWQSLISPIASVVGTFVEGRIERQKSSTELAKIKASAEADVYRKAANHEADWEKIMAQGSQNSLKDEALTIVFCLPLLLCFCGDWGREIVFGGFEALDAAPDYYKIILGTIVAASFGVRSATKLFKKK